jgi:hypothetical protein
MLRAAMVVQVVADRKVVLAEVEHLDKEIQAAVPMQLLVLVAVAGPDLLEAIMRHQILAELVGQG